MAETTHIRMARQYTHKIDNVVTRTFPQGWTGWIAASLAADLVKKGIATPVGASVDEAEAEAVSELRADLEAIIGEKDSEIEALKTSAQAAAAKGETAAVKLKEAEAEKKELAKQLKNHDASIKAQAETIASLQAALGKADQEIKNLKAAESGE